MRYRVIRDLGNADYVVGAVFDGDALDKVRLQKLVKQRLIESVADPEAEVAELRAALEEALTAPPAPDRKVKGSDHA